MGRIYVFDCVTHENPFNEPTKSNQNSRLTKELRGTSGLGRYRFSLTSSFPDRVWQNSNILTIPGTVADFQNFSPVRCRFISRHQRLLRGTTVVPGLRILWSVGLTWKVTKPNDGENVPSFGVQLSLLKRVPRDPSTGVSPLILELQVPMDVELSDGVLSSECKSLSCWRGKGDQREGRGWEVRISEICRIRVSWWDSEQGPRCGDRRVVGQDGKG